MTWLPFTQLVTTQHGYVKAAISTAPSGAQLVSVVWY